MKHTLLAIFTLLITSTGIAQVPVIDLNQNQGGAVTYPTSSYTAGNNPSNLPLEQQVRILQQQVANFTQMDLPGKIDKLQQQIQTLSGQLEVQAHAIQTLTDQQKNFYQDLNQRLVSSQATKTAGATPENSALSTGITKAESNVTENILPTADTTQPAIAPSGTGTDQEEKAYQAAFALLVKKQNVQAISAFQTFLTTYPNGTRTANAYYWLGELYSTENKNDLAAQQLNQLITQYPNDDKVPDAMLKLAIIDDDNGQHAKAQKMLRDIIQKYPNSSAARLAKMRLKQMN